MKKILCFTLFTVCLFGFQKSLGAEEESVSVSKIQGQALLIREGVSQPVEAGTPCKEKDVLKTSEGSQVDVKMNALAGFRLLASSETTFVNAKKEEMYLKLDNGNVVLNLKKLPAKSTFTLETPTAVAAVRGTQFWGRVDSTTHSTSVTTLAVRQGSIQIIAKQSGKEFLLKQGEALDIPSGGSLPQVRKALDAEMQAMIQASDIEI